MKRVGIMTWYYGANYGALAQSIALYNSIEAMGYQCEFINYKPSTYLKTICNSNLPRKRELFRVDKIVAGLLKIRKLSTTKYFKITQRVHSAEEINQLGFDYIVFGSDAIFNVDHPLSDELYFGVGISCKKIAYSPSCEYLSSEYELPESYIGSLKEMKALSVRDTNTQSLLKNNLKKEVEITLDPTFLYSFQDFNQERVKNLFLLIYSFSMWNEYRERIIEFAKSQKLIIVCLGQKLDWADVSLENADFELWVSLFKDADVVMTDSFHGTVFSIKNKKQIILCGREDKKAKIESLTQQFHISLMVYKGDDVERYLKENFIDYEDKARFILDEIDKSYTYLRYALEQ